MKIEFTEKEFLALAEIGQSLVDAQIGATAARLETLASLRDALVGQTPAEPRLVAAPAPGAKVVQFKPSVASAPADKPKVTLEEVLKAMQAKSTNAMVGEPDHPYRPDDSVAGPGPLPPDPEISKRALEEKRRQDRLTLGYETFRDLMFLWTRQFDLPGEQPDRVAALKELVLDGKKSGAVLGYVVAAGGLTRALRAITDPRHVSHDKVRQIAENVAQVASIIFPDLGGLLEYPAPDLSKPISS